MDRRSFLLAAGSGVSIGLAGCLEADAAPTDENTVEMTIDSFRPERMTVEPGTTVKFINTSSHAHTVTAFDDGIPDEAEFFATGGFEDQEAAEEGWDNQEGLLYTDESWEHTFEIPGTYQYYCVPHIDAEMVGFIDVEESENGETNATEH